MEGKRFLEVFPGFEPDPVQQEFLAGAVVTKVVRSRDGNSVRIYTDSAVPISYREVRDLERDLKKQVFRDMKLNIQIVERFPQKEGDLRLVMEQYGDSLYDELKDRQYPLYLMLKDGEVTPLDDHILSVELTESRLYQQERDGLQAWISDIFSRRFDMDVRARVTFRPPAAEEEDPGETGAGTPKAHGTDTEFYSADDMPDLYETAAETAPGADSSEISGAAGQAPDGEPSAEKTPAQRPPADKTSAQKPSARKARGMGKRGGQSDARYKNRRKMDTDNVFYGRGMTLEPMDISGIQDEIGAVCVQGQIIALEQRELVRSGKYLITFVVTDFTDSICVKLFVGPEDWNEYLKEHIAKGAFVRVEGNAAMDHYDHQIGISGVKGIKAIPPFGNKRQDNAPEKRVELHCHTKMSDMDGVTAVQDLLARAIQWGHPALAITDHGVVQAFTDAFHYMQAEKPENFKVIYGVEGYLVDDTRPVAVDIKDETLDAPAVVFDLETTGLNSRVSEIIEIGAVKVEKGVITDRFSTFIKPEAPIPYRIEELTGINDRMVADAPSIEEKLPEFLEFCRGCVLVAHNAEFDVGFITEKAAAMGLTAEHPVVDTVAMGRVMLPDLRGYKLDQMAKALGVALLHHHRAVDDAECTAIIYQKLLSRLKEQGVETFAQLNAMSHKSKNAAKKLPTYHVIILAKTEAGRVNLYRLISASHLDYYNRRPRIPKSLLMERREGLIIGSACEAGELFQAVVSGRGQRELKRLVDFYDYLEVQPIGNNAFMLRDERSAAKTEEDLQEYNRTILRLGKRYGKPVVATGDVHFMDPEDEIYRRICMAGKHFADADQQAPLYFRTTEEMLAEFSYLDPEDAYEIVVTNPRKIADSIDYIEPVRPDKCPPVIENSDGTLRDICYKKAHAMYGDDLPEIVEDRLERELTSIISNGYAVMYMIAHELVKKSNEDGYLVGSRGSVGSSFVATMSGITEVNPLPPHYYCKKCHYSEFHSERVKKYAGGSGCDMPDAVCPKCGAPLVKDGFDIPFETFLGFKGDKEPDIDLNFSGEYQSRAHDYTEVIFGRGQTFRAGTIGTMAAKTAYGYVMKYFEEHGVTKRRCEMERLAAGLEGIRRTTGQHPGGIIVLPKGEEIHSFTPVQHPANDASTGIITTHFDYHSIDHNLLKLDILGHDDPTMIRRLQVLTGVDPQTIPLDDKKVMSLFAGTEALGVTPEDIGGVKLGTLGIPEFGTGFAMQMLTDTKPTTFSDLVRIAGLAHGTDVWLGNAEKLIKDGTATISTAICTRDDIMTYLIYQGLDPAEAFTIMESVRKGKGLSDEWEAHMKEHDVPDWYIWSCRKIKYMFPKAHAAAYVMMAWRIAWCKIYYPLAYYAAFFSIRAKAFDYEMMCQGRQRLEYYMEPLLARGGRDMDSDSSGDEGPDDPDRTGGAPSGGNGGQGSGARGGGQGEPLTQKEKDTLRDMRIVLEFYARGFEFVPIDIYKAKASEVQITDGKLMPSLDSVDGMGEQAAKALETEAAKGPFSSRDDLRARCKVSKTVADLMGRLGLLDGIPESDQISLFDLL